MTAFSENAFKYVLSAACLVVVTLLFPSSVSAQDTGARLNRLENEMQTLSRAVFRGKVQQPVPMDRSFPAGIGAAAGEQDDNVIASGSAGVELRLQQIEMDLRSLTGKIEQQNFQTRQLQGIVEKTVADMEMRIAELERQSNVAGGTVVPPAAASAYPSSRKAERVPRFETKVIDSAEAPVTGQLGVLGVLHRRSAVENTDFDRKALFDNKTSIESEPSEPSEPFGTLASADPAEAYQRAFSLLRDRNYSKAGAAFQSFLDTYPDHDLAPNAQYWLGETFYVRDDFERAARIFAESYQQYPKGPKGPDNLLKLGMSLSALGKKEDACLTYVQLKKEYSKGAMPILARAEKEILTLDCP